MQVDQDKTAMSREDLKEYWHTLCSFTGDDIQNELKKLREKIHYPRFLYRYRSVNNNNLDALRTNKLFFSQASKYDDPFDTFLHIDFDRIRQEFEGNFKSSETINILADVMKQIRQIWTKELKRSPEELRSVNVYLKPEEFAAYYVINDEVNGKIDL